MNRCTTSETLEVRGPLGGVRVIELAGIGPAPFGVTMLADAGAEIIRVERPGTTPNPTVRDNSPFARGRKKIGIDLKSEAGVSVLLSLLRTADVLVESFRPGVMEKLGLGPATCLQEQPKLVYVRMTGWGQTGPLSAKAGHDVNYSAVSGAIAAIGTKDKPIVPLNLIGDFGGGGALLSFGIVTALLNARATGTGQVVDAAMSDGAALLMSQFYGQLGMGRWRDERESNLLDGGAPQYGLYRCADNKFVSVGALEPQFWSEFAQGLGLTSAEWEKPPAQDQWEKCTTVIQSIFLTRPRDDWIVHFAGRDACVSPVLSLAEAPAHPHNAARNVFLVRDGITHVAPSPRFSNFQDSMANRPIGGQAVAMNIMESAGLAPDEALSLMSRCVVTPA